MREDLEGRINAVERAKTLSVVRRQPFCLSYTLFIDYEKENMKSRTYKILLLYVFMF